MVMARSTGLMPRLRYATYMSNDVEITIEQPHGASLIACLGFLYDQLPVADRARLAAETMRQAAQGETLVFAAKQRDRFVAACAAQIVSADQVFVRLPRLLGEVGDSALERVWSELEAELVRRGASYMQATIPLEADAALLERVGFRSIARLSYLEADVESAGQPSERDVTLESYRESQFQRLSQVIEATYNESLDCPNVAGMRSLASVIEGYRETGDFREENWFFVRAEGEDVGCLLLTDHPSTERWELVYMGLNVEYRGRGLGAYLAEFAKWRAHLAGRKRIVVAVDSNNSPAISAYARSNFHSLTEQQVWAKPIAADAS